MPSTGVRKVLTYGCLLIAALLSHATLTAAPVTVGQRLVFAGDGPKQVYQVTDALVGEGGMGAIYPVKRLSDQKPFLVKVTRSERGRGDWSDAIKDIHIQRSYGLIATAQKHFAQVSSDAWPFAEIYAVGMADQTEKQGRIFKRFIRRDARVAFVMERAYQHDLDTVIEMMDRQANRGEPERALVARVMYTITRSLLSAVSILRHSPGAELKPMVHGDIKPSNVVFRSRRSVTLDAELLTAIDQGSAEALLIDFDFLLEEGRETTFMYGIADKNERYGTLAFSSWHYLRTGGYKSQYEDMYAVAAIVFRMVVGKGLAKAILGDIRGRMRTSQRLAAVDDRDRVHLKKLFARHIKTFPASEQIDFLTQFVMAVIDGQPETITARLAKIKGLGTSDATGIRVTLPASDLWRPPSTQVCARAARLLVNSDGLLDVTSQ